MADQQVLVERDGEVLIITINRPHARNAVTEAVGVGISRAIDELDDSPGLSVGVITGAGATFCAGMDLKAFVRGERPVVEGRGFAGLVEQPPAKPLIAAVEGYALAGGFEIVLACDLVVAGQTASFGLPEVKRSLVAAGGGLLRLPHRIAYHQAMEVALLGDALTAQRAYDLALVNWLVPDGQALSTAREIATRIAANGPLGVIASKRIIVESGNWSDEEAFSRQEEIAGPVAASHDALEGATAFAEKRAPVWHGR